MKNIIIGPGISGGGGGGLTKEIPLDNLDGTYTFSHVPVSVYIDGALMSEPENYTLSGITMTAISPSGEGLNVVGFY